jgi:hypothetical protein
MSYNERMLRFIVLMVFVPGLFAQSTDAVLTQTLINEIRALRQDLEATNVTGQRVQIALFRLQAQTAIVNTAQQRVDATRTKLAELENQRRSFASQIQSLDEAIRNGTATDAQKKEAQAQQSHMKPILETMGVEEAARRSVVVDAEAQLRAEQAKLMDLQSLLDRLDRALDELARPKK